MLQATYVPKEVPSINLSNLKDFEMQCRVRGMWVQEEPENPKLEAYFGDELMGYYDQETDKGFLFLDTLAPDSSLTSSPP